MSMKQLREGQVISGKYSLVRPLSRGGMGSLWVAQHLALDTEVAIKFIDPEIIDSAQTRARFDLEAKASVRLGSPHVVTVHDYSPDPECPYIVMELLDGEDLERRLRRVGRLSLPDTVRVIRPVCQALRAAHDAGLVHRDLKPSNIFLSQHYDEEIVKVLDFGVAKSLGVGAPKDSLDSGGTQSGALVGSPQYMSPEQVRSSRRVDHRTDLWSVAVVLFRCITGELPFPGRSMGEVLVEIFTKPAPVPSSRVAGLRPEIDPFFERALARDREERFQSARELLDAFLKVAGAEPRLK